MVGGDTIMEAKLYGQNKGGMSINGIIKDYYAYAGEEIKAGDLVEYINGVASKTDYGVSEDIAIDNTNENTGAEISAVQLDESRVFIAHSRSYGSGDRLDGIVCKIEGATITFGEDTPLNSITYSGETISAVKLDGNRVFIARCEGSYVHLHGMIVTIDGTSITVETDTELSNTSSTGKVISATLLPSGNVFIAHSRGSSIHLYGMVVTIDGTTITAGTDTVLVATTNAGYEISTCVLQNGNVFIAHSYGSYYHLYGIVVTIEGTTITKGTDTAFSSSANRGENISTCLLPNGNVFIAHGNNNLLATVCTVDGTTINKGEETEVASGCYRTPAICLLPNGKVLVFSSRVSGSYFLYGIICTIDRTTVTGGTYTSLSSNVYSGAEKSAILLNNGTVFVAHSRGSSYYLNAQIFGIDYENNIPTTNIIATEYETQVRQVTTGQFDGIAKTSGTGGDDTEHKDLVSIWTKVPVVTQEFAMADGNTMCDANGDIFLVREEK